MAGDKTLAKDDIKSLDYVTPVSYSIKFYYTPEFAASTPDVTGFVQQVVTVMNLGYIHSQVPLHAYVLCIEQAASLSEQAHSKDDASTTLRNFAALQGGNLAAIRDTADAAVLLVMGFGADDDSCGIGYLNSLYLGNDRVVTTFFTK